jgi:hypothetical protein
MFANFLDMSQRNWKQVDDNAMFGDYIKYSTWTASDDAPNESPEYYFFTPAPTNPSNQEFQFVGSRRGTFDSPYSSTAITALFENDEKKIIAEWEYNFSELCHKKW